jgi:tetratricopeptide (TPR) repeat protein
MLGRCLLLSAAGIALLLPACRTSHTQHQSSAGPTTRDGRLSPLLANLGRLHAPVTTAHADAQTYFNQGLTLVYAFNHAEALRSFQEAARVDPGCAMAYWGQALALSPNINDSAIGPDREEQGAKAIAEAVRRKHKASPKESALIGAMATRFAPAGEKSRTTWNERYAEAMKSVYAKFPADPDVATLYADAVMNTMPWDYWRGNEPKPGIREVREALERTIRDFPGHIGAHHLYIHLLEASDFVDLTVPSAEKLGSLAPGAGHLVHMPSHVFIRVGRYDDAAAANEKAVQADEDYITQCRAQGIYPATYYPHNVHFLNAALVMSGRSKEAIDAAFKVATRHEHHQLDEPGFGFAHLLKTIPMMTLVRFGKWDEVLKQPQSGAEAPYVRAMNHFARGFALSAQGKTVEAQAELEALRSAASHPSLPELKVFDVNSLDKLAAIAVAMLEGEIAYRKRDWAKAIAQFRKAAALEDALLYSEPPDWMLPPRHFLGAAQIAAGKPADAERTFQEDLRRHRNNGWGLAGLALALRKQGKVGPAGEAEVRLKQSWQRADIQIDNSRL